MPRSKKTLPDPLSTTVSANDDPPVGGAQALPDAKASRARTGTQSIERVVGMLRVVASRGRRGMRIGDVVSVSGLPLSTCFRMLQRLELEGLVERDPVSRKYHLGPLLYELGLLAQPRYRLSELCDPVLSAVAEATQDTAYLSERRGAESICTGRALGDYPIKALALDVGIRRPMGVGAGGLAILSALPAVEADAIIDANAHRYARFGDFDLDLLREGVAQARVNGYAFLDSVATPGSAAVGVAFPPEHPVAALSVAAISARMGTERRAEVAAILQRQVQGLCASMNIGALAPPSRARLG
ncbi:IclR family transcriptional regulator [Achromobacter sp. GG226]|uniref:IclR family transcriptional regulator n=1 Tax=Verticiella alkaliphila TaxID=2779529 RepID=UPI001C0D61C5|nr:IclR family transcriptional regulator [Verticiella sp. GG226]MBU4609960.1 IclR family transcriptional regulator [Verticiella sp. GG226]